jgi:PilZ domain
MQEVIPMKDEASRDRRHLERFSVKAFATVETTSQGAGQVFELQTQDISSGGAFFPMEVPLPTGEKVKITLYLSISSIPHIRELPNTTKIVTDGEIVRSSSQGIAVRFEGRYSISPGKS